MKTMDDFRKEVEEKYRSFTNTPLVATSREFGKWVRRRLSGEAEHYQVIEVRGD